MGMSLSTGKEPSPPTAKVAPEDHQKKPTPLRREGSFLGQEYNEITNEFKIDKKLGSGNFAVTYICKEKSTGKKYACKKISKKKIVTQTQKEDLKREIKIMEHLVGQEIFVQLKGTYEDDSDVYLVMEYCEGGELFNKMKSKGKYNEKVAAQILSSIMKVVYCLHFMGVMHRDLKPENFLLAKKAVCPCFADYTMLKAIDFGLSTYIDGGKPNEEKVGTAFYVAPEVIRHQPYGKEIDIWSAGVILYMLLTGVPPFNGESDRAIFTAVLKAKPDMENYPWPDISANAKNLVKDMLSIDPKKRPTAEDVLKHQWLKDNGVAIENPMGKLILEKMKYFRAMNKFKKLALKILTEMMPPEEIEGFRAMFRNLTKEENVVSSEELENSLVRSGHGPNDARLIVEAADTDRDGSIDISEFITAMRHFSQHKEDHIQRAFNHFDKDSDGFISKEELKSAMEENEIGDIEQIISEIDINKDEKISYEEFSAMIRR